MAAAVVDVRYLATHLGMPEAQLSTVATDPTADLVNAILSAVAAKAHEFDDLFSQKLQLEVELETNVRGAEAQRDASNETAKKALKDVEDIRQKLQEEETKRQSVENEIQSIKSSTSTSQSEIDTLRARITSLETSNRESLAIIDTKNSANDALSDELQAQHQKNLKLKQELATLQQSTQNANNAVNAAKFKEQSLQQQLDMAQRNAEFFENEYKTKSAELLKVRREKGSRITELERLNDDAASNIESLKRTEQQLRQRLDEAQKKADDAWTKIQQLQEAASRKEEDLKQESDSLRRLVDLKEQQTATTRNRLQEVETREEHVKRECEDQVRRISEDLARANLDKEELSQANESTQAEIGRLEAMLSGGSPGQPGSAPQTPRALNGSLHRAGSPFATPASMRKVSSQTQVLEEYYNIKGLLNVEKQRSGSLAKELDDVIEQLEAKGPELIELHDENDRLQQEMKNMSHMSDESFRERDSAKKAARKAEKAASQAQAEINILRNQLRDLGAQIQMLTFNMHCREKGLDQLSIDETLHLQQLERGQVDGNGSEAPSDVNAMILQRLVVFKDIQELQEKNEQLLQVTHELGQKMENEEAIAAKNQAIEDHKERIRLQQELEVFRDTLRAFQVKTENITKERDMFRRIVESRASAEASGLSHAAEDGVLASIEPTSTMNDDASDSTPSLRDLLQNFDQYRNEQAIDRKTMKEQNEKLSAERNSLHAEVSKITSQLSLASERFDMLQSNFAALQTENQELQKRSQTLSESAAKQDLRTQQVAEDLIEARGLAESMRSENANLKAEKNLWKDIQDRLSQDNENLMQEKSRLNGLLATQQTLQNERELTESETKRRLQTQIDTLEAELTTTKRKLTEEVEESKKAQLRKEFDGQQFQKRIDELATNLSQIREELVATKTSRDHLQSRVDELSIQLRSAEERAERLQPRPTPRPGLAAAGSEQTGLQGDADERIQDLIHEATDLKRDLDMTKSHLENAQTQVDRYKELAQASEEELERYHATHEQYEQEMSSSISTKDAQIKELEQRVDDLSSELSRSNTELSTLRDSQAEVARRFEDEKIILDEEIKRLKDEEERYTASAQFHKQDLRTQAEIATSAQQAYENEVMKHGKTATTLSNVRTEFTQLKNTVASWKADAESAKATLLQSESSWDERRQRFEQELIELRTRRDDANAQNKLLHEQLENVTSQISALKQSRASSGESLEAISTQPSGSDTDSFRELSHYLRQEKDILEVQYNLQVQEAKRMQQQVQYIQSQLDETRLKLEQERRSQGDSERSTMAHKDLMSKLEELNLFRESSAALRAEARQAQAQLVEKTTKVTELESTIQPLEAQIEELQSQQSFKDAEMKQIQEDRDRWQKRTEDILSKHGRTDPAEVEELKQTVAALETEKEVLQGAERLLKESMQELEQSIETKEADWAITKEKLINSAKGKARELIGQKNEIIAERDRLRAQLDEASGESSTTKQELEAITKEKLAAEEQIASLKRQIDTLHEQAQTNSGPPATSEPAHDETASNLQAQLAETRSELEAVSSQKTSVEEELQKLRHQLESVSAERDQAVSEAQERVTGESTSLENGVQASQGELPPAPLSDDERKALEERVAAAEAKAAEWEAKAKELEGHQDVIIKNRSDKMKDSLNKRLNEYKSQMEDERARSQKDKEALEADFKLRMDQERKIWEAEHASGTAEAKAPPTPSRLPEPETPAGTPTTTSLPSLHGLGDKEIRDFVYSNPTIKSIVQNNIKNKLAAETKKAKEEQEAVMKVEWEQKLGQARESATQLATSKANLKLNMSENKVRAATAKLAVVETAAKETPQRPVVEVWEVAKVAKPPPPPPKQPAPVAAAAGQNAEAAVTAVQASVTSSDPKPPPAGGLPKPVIAPAAANPSLPANPFANNSQPAQTQQQQAVSVPPNPFAQPAAAQQQQQPPQPPPAQQSQSQIPKASGLPVPQGGGARKASGGGPNQHRGGGRGGGGGFQRGGRGGGGGGGSQQGGGGRNSLNPSADNFQPGNKRPRGDSEAAGNGPKRARGGAGGGGGGPQ